MIAVTTTAAKTARQRTASVQSRRLQRARKIITGRDLWGPLQYMDDCPLGRREDGGDPTAMKRYLIVTTTDGGEDRWIDMKDSIHEVEQSVRGLFQDEWGLVGVWDLDRVSDDPLVVELTVRVTYPRTGATNG